MIITKIMGGLGNQMFQYAAARSLSLKRNTPLKLDISDFSVNEKRTYLLGKFNIQESFASQSEVERVRWHSTKGIFKITYKIFQRFISRRYRRSFRERQLMKYEPDILRTPSTVYLLGYWQNEKYFLEIKDIIEQEFSLRNPISQQTADYHEEISRVNSVSLHIRRGDYVIEEKTKKYHGVLNETYYYQAAKFIAAQTVTPTFFIFSDDISWAKENLNFDYPVHFIEDTDPLKPYEDLWLISKCKHHIIANSSFSWWGAWLCKNSDKIVCAPKNWFRAYKVDPIDSFPKSWHLF